MKTFLIWVLFAIWSCGAHCNEISMKGSLMIVDCSINNDTTIEVDFGSAVGINKVDGIHYRQPIPLKITCTRAPADFLNLIFSGTATNFDESSLATNNDDLGIQLLQDNMPIIINERLKIDKDSLPDFFAVPVKRPNSLLSSGEFSALVQLLILLN